MTYGGPEQNKNKQGIVAYKKVDETSHKSSPVCYVIKNEKRPIFLRAFPVPAEITATIMSVLSFGERSYLSNIPLESVSQIDGSPVLPTLTAISWHFEISSMISSC